MSEQAQEQRVEQALAAFKAGRMVVLLDDEDRENEGDLVLAADFVSADAINFMAREARGLICLALDEQKVRDLDLPLMVSDNRSSRSTAFTVSIEAREGVSTGISAADRAQTVRVAARPGAVAGDIVSPGHVFPLQARPGGVLQRSGHTEGAVDLARLAGLNPAAVICEIMNDDGTMARMPELTAYARTHALPMLTVADLITHRLRNESLVQEESLGEVSVLPVDGGAEPKPWRLSAFRSPLTEAPMVALSLGELGSDTLVRVHKAHLLGDALGVLHAKRSPLSAARRRIEAEGSGVLLLIPDVLDLEAELRAYATGQLPEVVRERGDVIREYGLGAQALNALGLRRIRLLTHRPRRLPSLDAFGIEVSAQLTLENVLS